MSTEPRTKSIRWVATLIGVATLFAYANTFSVPFVFDDIGAVTLNPSIDRLATALHPPDALSVTGRPIVNLSLALNYAISGRDVWSYHALNLALHLACALTLFGLIRRTLDLCEGEKSSGGAVVVAATTALLWALHPLQTSAVTYVMQRTELLVSLCYLLTLYAFVRGAGLPATVTANVTESTRVDSPRGGRGRRWLALSFIACALGMAAKEVMVTAPLLVLLYDRMFSAGTFRGALRARSVYYVLLATTWALLGALLFATDGRAASAGFNVGIAPLDYFLTQLYAIAHYLRLVFWPQPLIFDYGTAVVREPLRMAIGAIVAGVITYGTFRCFRQKRAIAFCGVFFFAVLAPSSSVIPIATQTMAEHRMHLALAVPLLLVALALQRWAGRRTRIVSAALIFACGATTFARNRAYASVRTLWQDTAAKNPANARAHYNHGLALSESGDFVASASEFEAALALEPNHALAHHKLGLIHYQRGNAAAALAHLRSAAQLQPNSASAHYDFAMSLIATGSIAEAAAHLADSIRLNANYAPARYNLGSALAQLGRYPEALNEFEAATRLDPSDTSARNNATKLREFLKK